MCQTNINTNYELLLLYCVGASVEVDLDVCIMCVSWFNGLIAGLAISTPLQRTP